jgi:hypothetical protein
MAKNVARALATIEVGVARKMRRHAVKRRFANHKVLAHPLAAIAIEVAELAFWSTERAMRIGQRPFRRNAAMRRRRARKV